MCISMETRLKKWCKSSSICTISLAKAMTDTPLLKKCEALNCSINEIIEAVSGDKFKA